MMHLFLIIIALHSSSLFCGEIIQRVTQDFVDFAHGKSDKPATSRINTEAIKRDLGILKLIAQDILSTAAQSGLPVIPSDSQDNLQELISDTPADEELLQDIATYEALNAQIASRNTRAQTPLSLLTLTCIGSSSQDVRSATNSKFPINLASQALALEYLYNFFIKQAPEKNQSLKKAVFFSLLTALSRCLKERKKQNKFFTGIEIATIVPAIITTLKGAAGSLIGLYSMHKVFKWFTSGDEAKKELLAQRIEMRYKEFCDKYKKSIEKLEDKIERMQDEARSMHRELGQAQEAIGSLKSDNHRDVEKIHGNIKDLEAELKKIFTTDASIKQRKIEEVEAKIQQTITQTQTFQDQDIQILDALKAQLLELKTDIGKIKEINGSMTTQLHTHALPKIVEIASEFHSFATKEQLRYLTIIKCLMTNKEMRKIIDKASAVLPE